MEWLGPLDALDDHGCLRACDGWRRRVENEFVNKLDSAHVTFNSASLEVFFFFFEVGDERRDGEEKEVGEGKIETLVKRFEVFPGIKIKMWQVRMRVTEKRIPRFFFCHVTRSCV